MSPIKYLREEIYQFSTISAEEVVPISFYEINITVIPKTETLQEDYRSTSLINIYTKITNLISQSNLKMYKNITHQVGFISDIQG